MINILIPSILLLTTLIAGILIFIKLTDISDSIRFDSNNRKGFYIKSKDKYDVKAVLNNGDKRTLCKDKSIDIRGDDLYIEDELVIGLSQFKRITINIHDEGE